MPFRSRSNVDRPTSPGRRRLVVGAAAVVVALGAGLVAAPASGAPGDLRINLVTVNDFHGRIEEAAPSGGIAALATAVNQIRAQNERTVFAAAGDMIGASTFTSFIQQDVPTIETLNAAGLEVSAAGNHEFDLGWDDLRERVQGLADWEYIAANVFERSTGQTALAESWVKDFGDVKIGFIGAVTEELPSLVSPAGIATLEVRDIVDSVNAAADRLTDGSATNGEADVLVLLIHEGAADTSYNTATDPNTAFGQIVTNASSKINAIVSGHTHLAYSHMVPYGGDTGLRPVISSGQYGEMFSNMVIEVDPVSKAVTSMVNTTYPMYTGTTPNYPPVAGDPLVDPIVAAVAAAKAEADVLGAVKLGDLTGDFNRARLASGAENRGGESTLGNFVADAQLWAAQRTDPAAQIALMNPGGLRADMVDAPDELTYKEAALVQPFANTLVTLTLTGDQIRRALEQQVQPSTSSRPYLKLGISKGFEYIFDPTAVPGERITRMTLNDVEIDLAGSYRVVVNSFLASGGDNFGAIAEGVDKRDSGQIDLASMVDYMAFLKTATPDLAQRSIGVVISDPIGGGAAYGALDTIALALSSLDFSANEQRATTVNVSIDGRVVGTASITPNLPTVLSDVSGTANLSVVIPRRTSGTVPLTITTDTGTSFEWPIAVVQKAKSTLVDKTTGGKKGEPLSIVVTVKAKGTPTGTVTLKNGATVVGTAEVIAGKARFTLTDLAPGRYTFTAEYSGDAATQASDTKIRATVR